MYRYEDIEILDLEITERCQAACPMCPRNMNGGAVNPLLTMAELTLEDCKKIFEPDFIKQLKTMYMCGNFGDAIIAKDTLEVFQYFREHNPDIFLAMHTNGGARKVEWWDSLAKTFGQMGRVIFSVDGLKDTNHIYRQNVNWDIVERSMKAFINAGGRARWDYIVFEHNEHQVEEAEEFSRKLGFEGIQFKKSDRFWSHVKNKKRDYRQVYDKEGKEAHIISQPKDKKYHNTAFIKKDNLIEQHGDMETFYDKTNINCRALEEKKIYISAEGLLLPCCWIGTRLYRWYYERSTEQILEYIEKAGGKEKISVHHNSIEDIMNGRFNYDVENSWSCSSVKTGKLLVCSQQCGTGFTPFTEQFN